MTSNETVIDLCQRIDAVFTDADEPDAIFRAMFSVLTKHMSQLCAECRKDLARELKQRIPDMLRRANAAAAERERAQEQDHLRAQCH
jgi:hypothetical protein